MEIMRESFRRIKIASIMSAILIMKAESEIQKGWCIQMMVLFFIQMTIIIHLSSCINEALLLKGKSVEKDNT